MLNIEKLMNSCTTLRNQNGYRHGRSIRAGPQVFEPNLLHEWARDSREALSMYVEPAFEKLLKTSDESFQLRFRHRFSLDCHYGGTGKVPPVPRRRLFLDRTFDFNFFFGAFS